MSSSPPQLLLYEHPVSSYVQMVKIALREKSVAFAAKLPEDLMRAAPTGAFASANPRAEVPALVDGDVTLFETGVILEYIEDKWPSPPLLFPEDAGPAKRAEMRLTGEVARTQYEAVNWAIGEVRTFKRAEGDHAAKIERNAQYALDTLHDWLTKRLGSAAFFSGTQFGYADICVAPVVNRSLRNGMGPAPGSALHEWLLRVQQRPSVQQTFEEFAAGAAKMSDLSNIFVENGPVKREYRDHRLDFLIRAGGIDVVLDGLSKKNIRFSWPHVPE